jgi:hypothetical protein
MNFTEQLNPTGRIDDRLNRLNHWTPQFKNSTETELDRQLQSG